MLALIAANHGLGSGRLGGHSIARRFRGNGMAIWWLLGVIGAGAAVGTVASKTVQRRVRAARDDHNNRPALWNRFYSIN